MTDAVQSAIIRYASKGILIDTNILLLYFIGRLNRYRIEKFKRTKRFTAKDYDILIDFIGRFNTVITTPNILTEVSSMINQLGEPERSECYVIFANEIGFLQENYVPSQSIASTHWSFQKYGLTDSGIASASPGQYLVLTDDFDLARYLNSLNIDTLNFNNLRA